mmetsp:Transcript_31921/g.98822  ORF Transcript_31921/g.98822 Transcript_31921/m.98822 type:complete len:207 (-) Transcript_31921:678-1298(-)
MSRLRAQQRRRGAALWVPTVRVLRRLRLQPPAEISWHPQLPRVRSPCLAAGNGSVRRHRRRERRGVRGGRGARGRAIGALAVAHAARPSRHRRYHPRSPQWPPRRRCLVAAIAPRGPHARGRARGPPRRRRDAGSAKLGIFPDAQPRPVRALRPRAGGGCKSRRILADGNVVAAAATARERGCAEGGVHRVRRRNSRLRAAARVAD